MANTTIKLPTFGTATFGTRIFGGAGAREVETFSPPVVNYDEKLRATYRLGRLGLRNLREPYNTKVPIDVSPGGGSGGVSFGNGRGVNLGTEFSNVRHPNLVEMEWSRRPQGGCREAKVTLRKKPDFALRNFMIVQMAFDGEPVFTGFTRISDDVASTKQDFTFRVTGLYKQFSDAHDDVTIAGPIDLGLAARDLFLSIQSQTNIGYNPAKFNVNTLVTSVGDIELGKHSYIDVMNALAMASGHKWGVDEVGDAYFLPHETGVQRSIIVGLDVHEFLPELNYERIVNSVLVKRQEGKASGAAGWITASAGFDAESIANFGLYHKEFTMPGTWEDALADAVRDNILANNKDPKTVAKLKDLLVRDATDLFADGVYRVIGPVEDVREDVNNCENLGDFTLVNSSGQSLPLTLDSGIVVNGATSLKVQTVGDASGDIVFFNVSPELRGFIRRIIFNVYSSEAGQVLELGAGRFLWDEYSKTDIGFTTQNSWEEVSLPIPFANRNIGQIGFRIMSTAALTLYIDQIEIETHTRKHFNIALEEVRYKIGPDQQTAQVQLGPQMIGIEHQLAGVRDLAEQNNYNQEIR